MITLPSELVSTLRLFSSQEYSVRPSEPSVASMSERNGQRRTTVNGRVK